MSRSNERGIAMVFALFMMLALSLLGTSLMFVSRTETVSSQNYRMMSQARYGAESAIHKAANYLINNYGVPQPGGAIDPYEGFTQSVNGITYNGQPVVLSSDISQSNYPILAKKQAFAAFTTDSLTTSNDGVVNFTATATLKSMRKFKDGILGTDAVVQTWQLVGDAVVPGANEARIQVSAVMETQAVPVYRYAAFATARGCAALSFRGGAITNSYNSRHIVPQADGRPTPDPYGGNVGTNGNLTEVGSTTIINGSLSTPREGVGACSSGSVTAESISGQASVGAYNHLSQEVRFPTPNPPIPVPPTTDNRFPQDPCPANIGCSSSGSTFTIHPPSPTTPIVLGNVSLNATSVLHLGAGTYNVNSFTMNGNSQIVIDSGPVIFNVQGQNQGTPITINGGGIVNSTYKPENLQFLYGGTGTLQLNGGEKSAALFYAPNASASINGQADLYGAIVVQTLLQSGGGEIHYDRNLDNLGNTIGNPWMSSFNWSTY